MKYGPTRGELKFRLVFSGLGLLLMAFALQRHGVRGIAWVEIVGLAGAFFGGTGILSAWRLLRMPADGRPQTGNIRRKDAKD
jgi:hypothetical protein